MKTSTFLILAGGLLAAGCTTDGQSSAPPDSSMMDASVPQVARDACLREVRRTTNTSDLTIISMEYSEANSEVKIGVGPNRAPWRCLVSSSGVVAQVMSLTNEGAL